MLWASGRTTCVGGRPMNGDDDTRFSLLLRELPRLRRRQPQSPAGQVVPILIGLAAITAFAAGLVISMR